MGGPSARVVPRVLSSQGAQRWCLRRYVRSRGVDGGYARCTAVGRDLRASCVRRGGHSVSAGGTCDAGQKQRKRAFPKQVCGADWRQVLLTSLDSLRSSTLWYFFSTQSPFTAYGGIPALKLRVCCSRHRLIVNLFELITFQSLHTAHGQARRIWSELELSKDHTWSRIVDLLQT